MTREDQPMTLTKFLLARIAEDEAEALRAIGQRDATAFTHEPEVPDMTIMAWPDSPIPAVLIGPERVLVECEAKRRVVNLHERATKDYIEAMPGRDGVNQSMAGLSEHVVELLALPYADHPDYNPAWRV